MDERIRLGSLIRERRRWLGLTMASAAAAAGIDRNTWSTAESGSRRIVDNNYAGIERAIGWAPGSIAAVLAGGEPTPAGQPLATGPADLDERLAAEVERITALPMGMEHKLRMIQALVDAYAKEQRTDTDEQDGQRRAS